jgi:DNA-binding response OmpR family regulator
MKGYHILIVEDDPMIGELLKKILIREQYHVCWKKDSRDILKDIKNIDLIIMDVMLPYEDGFQITRKIKNLGLNIPIFFLSARGDIESRLEGLTIGEDYLIKPYDPRELLLRIKKLLENKYGSFLQIKHLFINAEEKRVFMENVHHEIEFTAIERKIFFYLYENRNKTLTKEHFLQYLWNFEDRNPNIINVHIKKIRAKINDSDGEIIQNIYGEGYRLNTYVKK